MRTVLFIDLDNTLVINPLGRHALPSVYRYLEEKYSIDPEEVKRYMIRRNLELLKIDPVKAFDWDYILQEYISARLGIIETRAIVLDEHLKHCSKTLVFDDVIESLEILRREGYVMILATNGLSKYQECVIRHTGLYKYFDEIHTPDKIGFTKNSERFYQIYSLDLGEENIEKIVIGDDLYFDVYYPSSIGLRTILVKRFSGENRNIYLEYFGINYERIKPSRVVNSLKELSIVIKELASTDL